MRSHLTNSLGSQKSVYPVAHKGEGNLSSKSQGSHSMMPASILDCAVEDLLVQSLASVARER